MRVRSPPAGRPDARRSSPDVRWLVRLYGKLTNLAGAPVDVHPWLVPGWSLFTVMGWDDLRLRPLAREELLERGTGSVGRRSTRGWL